MELTIKDNVGPAYISMASARRKMDTAERNYYRHTESCVICCTHENNLANCATARKLDIKWTEAADAYDTASNKYHSKAEPLAATN